ncbi:MAG: hypothetical protein IJY33_04760 [Oscillospiraceae bacterium]|nr:hypothetical protein [Oscillospiraceae bacterium]
MKKTKKNKRNQSRHFEVMNSPRELIIFGILAICFGIFFIFVSRPADPIPREQAVSYSGEFERYMVSKNYCAIEFKDGSCHELYPHTETGEFRDKMQSLEKGTKLHILINPNSNYIAEIKTNTEELLNFELSQEDIVSYSKGYIYIGVFVCFCGVFLIFFAVALDKNRRNEKARFSSKVKQSKNKTNAEVLRYIDPSDRSKILLQVSHNGYEICYRRVGIVNELAVNGRIYDEKKAFIEFEHKLYATVDGHHITAGLDKDSYSFISFNGKRLDEKKRLI